MNNKFHARKKLTVFVVVVIALFPLFFEYWYRQREKLEPILWEMAAEERSAPLAKIKILEMYDSVCVLDPRALRSGGKQPADAAERSQKPIAELFGEISFGPYQEEIIKRHVHHYSWIIYAVRSNTVMKGFPLKSSEVFGYEMDSGFNSGCYAINSVCVREKDSGGGEKRTLLIGRCKE